jgi:hypothetical protein
MSIAHVEYSLSGMPNVYENDYLYEVDMCEACYMQYRGPIWAVYSDWNNPKRLAVCKLASGQR